MTSQNTEVTADYRGPLRGPALDAFLALPLISRLSCNDHEGWPYAVPIWHEWDGTGFWIVGIKEAAWPRYLLADPRVAICIDATDPLRRVLCQGEARLVHEPAADARWIEIAVRMFVRYLGTDPSAARDASSGIERWLFYVEPKTMLTWHGPGRYE